MKKPLKQVIKTKGKIDRLINEKPPNPAEKLRRKTDLKLEPLG